MQQRLEYLDFVKGFGILLVILGHIYEVSNPIRIWVYSFHISKSSQQKDSIVE